MPTKLQQYSELAEQSINRLTNSRENWTAYLAAAARLYKYPFTEQLMIYHGSNLSAGLVTPDDVFVR